MGEPEELSSHTADPAFPQELFDCILQNVVDRQTLAKCALVNRTWGRRCQELIFREISLYADDHPQVQALLELLTESPHIRPLIRELSIYNLPVRMKPEPQFDNDIGFIISCAVNLTHFTLQFNTCGRRVRYGDLPDFLTATVRPALRHLAHLYSVTFYDNAWLTGNVVNLFRACDGSTVTKISVIDIDGPLGAAADNLLSFPNVTEIEFRSRRFMDASVLHPWLSHPLQIFPRLRIMTFGVSSSQGVNDIHVNLLLPRGLPGLRCFKVVWHASTPTPLYLQKRSGPNSAAEITMPMLAIGTFRAARFYRYRYRGVHGTVARHHGSTATEPTARCLNW
ncbi:hypothetical protein BDZ89DRAFT_545076 [Hymenopellis radicata]|nr:hypothetical protein BDZ89DRAFT_545076 [Hymenopellis radicata]